MKNIGKGLTVALLHILIVLSLGGKLLYDRAHRPRLWVRTASFDPDLPVRGRYLTLNLEVHGIGIGLAKSGGYYYVPWQAVHLTAENGRLLARPSEEQTGLSVFRKNAVNPSDHSDVYFLSPEVTFFIPEHAAAPHLKPGDELWAEVTIPKKGPPRPIQLAMKHGTEWQPLTYR